MEDAKAGGSRGELWSVLRGQHTSGERFRAAWALATFDTADGKPDVEGWQSVAPFVAGELLAACGKNPSHYEPLLNALRPVGAVRREGGSFAATARSYPACRLRPLLVRPASPPQRPPEQLEVRRLLP